MGCLKMKQGVQLKLRIDNYELNDIPWFALLYLYFLISAWPENYRFQTETVKINS